MSWSEAHKWIVRNADDVVTFSISELEKYLRAEDIHAKTSNGCTLMHFAALTACAAPLMKYLVSRGAGKEVRDRDGATPLHWASRSDCGGIATQTLLQLGASPWSMDNNGNSPLHYAAECGNVSSSELLLKAMNFSTDVTNFRGRTPLHFACLEEERKMIRFLVRKGAKAEDRMVVRLIRSNSRRTLRSLLRSADDSWPGDRKQRFLEMARQEGKMRSYRELRRLFSV